MKKIFLVIPIVIVIIAGLLYFFNSCTEGGITGNINKCDCVGIKVKKTSANYPDAFQEYACIGFIQ